MIPEGFHFLRPLWLLGLAALPLLFWLAARPARDLGAWRRVLDPELLPHLVLDSAQARRRSGPWLAALWVVACVALAGPAWERVQDPVVEPQQARVLVLSLSDSMLAADLAPNRLQRARMKLVDLIDASRGWQLGLLVYAGDAFTVAPLTDDPRTLLAQVDALHPDLMPVQGSRLDLALQRAAKLLRDAGFAGGDIVVLADGADSRAVAVAAELAREGVRTSLLGFGTAAGAPIPLAEGGFRRDAGGNLMLPRLDPAGLLAVAQAGRGRYLDARADRSDVDLLAAPPAARLGRGEGERVGERYLDRGPWLALLLLPLALLAWRRGALAGLALLLALPFPADAFEFADLWQRREQRAHSALLAGEHARAAEWSSDPARRGAAAYRDGAFEAAIAAFRDAPGASGRYNLGNALAMAGRFDEAMAAYREALAIDPGLEDAQANLDAIRAWLERQPPPDAGESGQSGESHTGGQGEGNDAPRDPASEASSDPEREADGRSGTEGQPGETDEPRHGDAAGHSGDEALPPAEPQPAGDGEDVAAAARSLAQELEAALADAEGPGGGEVIDAQEREAEEQRQMVEQWLRRVPDDPGALLRRKFAVEHRRRQAEGGAP
jgi:Ca-activated chloride channel family protein